ncbi:MAG: hypothetical protein GF393_06930 [Armatimonadia bacterium]|nr:hypothetical protein [Armatimonadia bacterium]
MQLVTLDGSPEDVGRTLGELWRADLAADTEDFFARMAEEGLDEELLLRESRPYRRRIADLAPHMLEEMLATAEAAGVPEERFVAYQGLKYTFPQRVYKRDDWVEPREGCTSFMAIGEASGIAANLVHKNRDADMVPQSAHIKQIDGGRRVLGGGDVGHIGLCHALNADGLAGKTNSGNGVDTPLRHSISTTEILRHVVEQCSTCDEALERMRDLSAAGLITNGTGGCIWLFADREQGLIVEEVPFKLKWRFVEDEVEARGNEFKLPGMREEAPDTPRYATAIARMRELAGRAMPEDLNALSRSTANHPTSICHAKTNSATTSVVPFDRSTPPYWEMAVGHPNNTCYLPMSPAMPGLPRPVVDGSLWRLSERLFAANPVGAHPRLAMEEMETRFRHRHAAAHGPMEMAGALTQSVRELQVALQQAVRPE